VLEGRYSRRGQRFETSTVVCQSRCSNDLPQAALFPCGVSLAATWNKNILFSVGQHLADEAKARSAQVLLAPTVCLHRGPLGGRNFESFSEDPYLTGKLAASYINGLQGKGVAATIKREYTVVNLWSRGLF
jgi:beta-glucosidase-like glycosyl hydrolase